MLLLMQGGAESAPPPPSTDVRLPMIWHGVLLVLLAVILLGG